MMSLKGAISEVNKAVKHANEVSKKLTTKDRKKLKQSTYCGPNRSFPIPDCKHVAVAKAYLNRSKFSSATKKRIAACINRKAKELNCQVSKPAKAKGSENLTTTEVVLRDSEIFRTTKELVDQSLKNGEMELDFSGVSCEI